MSMVDRDSNPHVNVTLNRVAGGRLGFKIRTIPAKHVNHEENETVTLAYGMPTPLPNDSLSSAKLWNDDRIVEVNGRPITFSVQSDVARLLKDSSQSQVSLKIWPRFGDRFNYTSKSRLFTGGQFATDADTSARADNLEKSPILSSNVTPVKQYSDYMEFSPPVKSPHNFNPQILNERTIFQSSPSVASQEYIGMKSINRSNHNSEPSQHNSEKKPSQPSRPRAQRPSAVSSQPKFTNHSTSVDNIIEEKSTSHVVKSLFKSPFRSRSDNTLLRRKSPSSLQKESSDTSRGWHNPLFCEKCGKRVNLCVCFQRNLSTHEQCLDDDASRSHTPVNKIISDIFDKKKGLEYRRGRCRRADIGNDCRCLTCTQSLLDWQQDIIKKPHMVCWHPETKVVSLERNKRENLGFTFKVKIGKNNDGSPEVYTLVEHVKKDSIADGHLFVGDWIRSVNGRPLYTTKEALNLNRYVEKNGTLRFIIQRPESFRDDLTSPQKPNNSYYRKFHSPSPLSKVNGVMAEKSKSAVTLACSQRGNDIKMVELKPAHTHSQLDVTSVDLNEVANHFDKVALNDKKHATKSSSSLSQNRSAVSPHATCSNTSTPASSGIHMTYIKNNPAALDENVPCPWRQIFIVGNQAVTLAQLMFPDMKDVIFAAWIEKDRKFINFKSAVQLDEEGITSVVDFTSSRDAISLPVLLSQWFCTHTEISAEDVLLGVEQSLGEPSMKFTPWIHTKTVGLDVFIVLDDTFFNTCCHPIFSDASIFFVAFDACKLLTKNDDLSRISDMIHTAQCFAHRRVAINLYGVLECQNNDQASKMVDELRTLLYTDKGKPIFQQQNVNMPAFIVANPYALDSSNDTFMLQTNLCENVFHCGSLNKRFRVMTLLVWAQVVKMRQRGQHIVTVGNLIHCFKENAFDLSEPQATQVIGEMAQCGCLLLACDKRKLSLDGKLQSTDVLLTDLPYALDCIQSLITSLERTNHVVSGKSHRHKMSSVSGREIDHALSSDEKDANIWTTILKNLDVIFQLYQRDDVFIVPFFSENATRKISLTEHSDVIELVFNENIAFTSFLKLAFSLSWTYHHADVILDSLSCCRVINEELTIRLELVRGESIIRITTLPKFDAELPKTFQLNLNEAYHDVFHNSPLRVTQTLVNGTPITAATSNHSGGDDRRDAKPAASNRLGMVTEKSVENGFPEASSISTPSKQIYSVYM